MNAFDRHTELPRRPHLHVLRVQQQRRQQDRGGSRAQGRLRLRLHDVLQLAQVHVVGGKDLQRVVGACVCVCVRVSHTLCKNVCVCRCVRGGGEGVSCMRMPAGIRHPLPSPPPLNPPFLHTYTHMCVGTRTHTHTHTHTRTHPTSTPPTPHAPCACPRACASTGPAGAWRPAGHA